MEVIHLKYPLEHSIHDIRPCILALGFFDGVHLGHQQVIHTAKTISDKMQLELAVMTFTPHPKQVVGYTNAPINYLTPLHVKAQVLKELGVQRLYVIHFDQKIAQLSSDAFVEQCLIKNQVQHVVAGFDFRFGNKGKGNMETLKKQSLGRFGVTSVNEVGYLGQKVSSTLIRELLSNGEVHKIENYLGTKYEIVGEVSSLMGFNPADRHPMIYVRVKSEYILPKQGFYDVELRVGNTIQRAVCKVLQSADFQIHIFPDKNQISYERIVSIASEIKIKWLREVKGNNVSNEPWSAVSDIKGVRQFEILIMEHTTL